MYVKVMRSYIQSEPLFLLHCFEGDTWDTMPIKNQYMLISEGNSIGYKSIEEINVFFQKKLIIKAFFLHHHAFP
jgi:hypothetical protein